jgi:hypothetical protein
MVLGELEILPLGVVVDLEEVPERQVLVELLPEDFMVAVVGGHQETQLLVMAHKEQ